MKPWTIIQSKSEYESVLRRIEDLSQVVPSIKSDEGRELMLLGYLVDQYEEKMFPILHPNPIDAIKVRMEDLSLSMNDLLNIFGDRGTASKILNGQRSLSLRMIRELSEKLSLPVSLLIQPPKKEKTKARRILVHEPKSVYRKSTKRK